MASAPVGSVIAFGGAVDGGPPPDGWLLCDGKAVSRATYGALFAAIGESSGAGDGTSTFNLPDYRGRFLRGVDDGANRDKYLYDRVASNPGGHTAGNVGSVQQFFTARPEFITTTAGEHSHSVLHLPTDRSYYWIAGSHYAAWNAGSVLSDHAGAHSHKIVGGDAESRPVNLYVHFLIYAGADLREERP